MTGEALISTTDLAISSALLLANAGISLALRLGVARSLLVAAVRALVQLLLVGMVLRTVFALQSPWLIGLVALFMFASASREVYARQQRKLKGLWGFGIGAGTTMVAMVLATFLGLLVLRPHPWWSAEVLIPLVGLVLGNIMNGVSLTLNAFSSGLVRERSAIEARLALGATRQQALGSLQRRAVHAGVIPALNQMSAAGIITLPGMMTGQILAGMSPFEAAKYQILVLFLIGGGAALGAIAVSGWMAQRVSDERDRLRLDRLESPAQDDAD